MIIKNGLGLIRPQKHGSVLSHNVFHLQNCTDLSYRFIFIIIIIIGNPTKHFSEDGRYEINISKVKIHFPLPHV